MKRHRIIGMLSCFALAACTSAALALGDEAPGKFAEGNALVAKGDLAGALKAYTAAAKAAPDNQEYAQKASLLRRVIEIRKKLDQLNGEAWIAAAQALHGFYHENQLFEAALPLDRKLHEKVGSGDSAAALARTELALKSNAEAAELLRGLSKDQANLETQVLLGLALARLGDLAGARTATVQITMPENTAGQLWFDLASVQAMTGEAEKAVTALTRGFEATPPSQLDAARQRVKASPDFASLKDQPAFAKACTTESKVSESKCSSGATCGKCPSRDKCSKEEAAGGKSGQPEPPCTEQPKGEKPKP